MTSPPPPPPREKCPCGSGLHADRCCALDFAASWPSPQPSAAVQRARKALAQGDFGTAEPLLLDVLEASPLHLGALALLQELRAAQGLRGASEALLARVVRLDPNQVAATQSLALALFSRGALA